VYSIGCKEEKHSDDISKSDSITKTNEKSIEKVKAASNNQDSFEVNDLNEIKAEYINRYKDTSVYDTSIVYNGDKVNIHFRHYCLFDSVLKLPEKYIEMYKLKEFTTHSFQSTLKISIRDNVIIDTIITKNTFAKILPPELKEYGVLLYPNVHLLQDHLIINYSISIPLTDIGSSYSFSADYLGQMKIESN
jgi:hypothetical protein